MRITYEEFLKLPASEIHSSLMHFCHCSAWAEDVLSKMPVATLNDLENLMIQCWSEVNEQSLLEAFDAHPMIGDIKVLEDKFATQAHAEQGQVKQADRQVLESLLSKNKEYLEKFGFIFIICAKGRSAKYMLEHLVERLNNDRSTELKNAAIEQKKIMQLRLHQGVQ